MTGASSGLGLHLARLLAADGFDLVLVARRQAALEELSETLARGHGIRARAVVQDLAEPRAASSLFARLGAEAREVAILVNNAGFGTFGPFHAADPDTQEEMVRVNVGALTELTRLLLDPMLARGWGRIMNVASTAAFQPGPLMAVYYASKAFVLSFSESLSEELRDTGITVTAFCPGPTPTEFQDRAGVAGSRLLNGWLMRRTDPETVAHMGYEGMMQGRRIVIPGLLNRVLAQAYRITPRWLMTRVVGVIQR